MKIIFWWLVIHDSNNILLNRLIILWHINLITSSTPYKDFMKLALIILNQENAPISPNKWHITKSNQIKTMSRMKRLVCTTPIIIYKVVASYIWWIYMHLGARLGTPFNILWAQETKICPLELSLHLSEASN